MMNCLVHLFEKIYFGNRFSFAILSLDHDRSVAWNLIGLMLNKWQCPSVGISCNG